MVRLVERLNSAGNHKSEISDLKSLAESCSRQLRGWADSLQNSDIKGQRHLTDQSRALYDQKKGAEEFQRRLARSLHDSRPDVFPNPDVGD